MPDEGPAPNDSWWFASEGEAAPEWVTTRTDSAHFSRDSILTTDLPFFTLDTPTVEFVCLKSWGQNDEVVQHASVVHLEEPNEVARAVSITVTRLDKWNQTEGRPLGGGTGLFNVLPIPRNASWSTADQAVTFTFCSREISLVPRITADACAVWFTHTVGGAEFEVLIAAKGFLLRDCVFVALNDLGPLVLSERGIFRGASAERERQQLAEEEAARTLEARRKVGQHLRGRRERASLTTSELADRVGLKPLVIVELEEGLEPLTLPLEHWVDVVWATRDPWPDPRQREDTGAAPFSFIGETPLEIAESIVANHLSGLEDISELPLARWIYDVRYRFPGAEDLGDLPRDFEAALNKIPNVFASNVNVRVGVDGADRPSLIMECTVHVLAKEQSTAFGRVQAATTKALGGDQSRKLGDRRRSLRRTRDIQLTGPGIVIGEE